jgi:hypothetical protein
MIDDSVGGAVANLAELQKMFLSRTHESLSVPRRRRERGTVDTPSSVQETEQRPAQGEGVDPVGAKTSIERFSGAGLGSGRSQSSGTCGSHSATTNVDLFIFVRQRLIPAFH